MASPSIIASTNFEDGSNTTSRTINVPAGGTTNDWYAIFVGMDGISGITIGDFTTIRAMVADTGSHEIAIGLRKYTGGEGATFTVGSASETGHGVCVLIRGIDSSATTANILDFLSGSHIDAINNGVMAPRGYCDSADTLLLAFCCGDAGYANTTGNGIPSGYAEIYQDTGISGGVGISLVEADQAATGYSTIPQWTTSNIDTFLGVQLAFRSTLTDTAAPAYPPCKAMEIWHNESATTALKILLPYGTVEDDGLLFQGACESDHFSIPADFTQVQKSNPDTSIYAGVWEFVADASMPTDYTFTTTGTSAKSGCLKRYTNIDTANFVDNSSVATGTSAAPTCSTITPTVDNCTIDYFFGSDDDDATFQTGGFTGKRLLWVQDNQANADVSSGSSIEEQTTKAATGSVAATLNASEGWVAIAVAIAPAAASGPTGTASGTEDDDTGSASGDVFITGTASGAEEEDSGSAAGDVFITGAASGTEEEDSGSASGDVFITGTASGTEEDDTGSASGTVTDAPITGSASGTEDDDTGAASGTVLVAGTVSTSEEDDTGTASGTIHITGTATGTEDDDSGSAAGDVFVTGTGSGTEDDDTGSASGGAVVSGAAAGTEEDDSGSAAGVVYITGSSTATEEDDSGAAAGLVLITGGASGTEEDDSGSAEGAVGSEVTGTASGSEDDDTGAAVGLVLVGGTSVATEENDTGSATGTAGTTEIFLPTAGYKGDDFYGRRQKLIKQSNMAAAILFCT